MQIALWPQTENTGRHCHCQVCLHHFWTERLNIGSSLTKAAIVHDSLYTINSLIISTRLVLEVLNKKKKALIILLDCQQFFSTEKDTQHNIPNVHRSRTTVQLNSRHVQKVYENPKKRC